MQKLLFLEPPQSPITENIATEMIENSNYKTDRSNISNIMIHSDPNSPLIPKINNNDGQ